MSSSVNAEESRTSFPLIKEELKKQIPRISLLVALSLIGTGVGLVQPLLFKHLLDTAIPAADVRLIGLLLVGMVAVPVLSAGFNSANHYLRAYIGAGVAQRLRQELFDHLLFVRLADLEQFKTGEHIYRLTRSCGLIGEVYVGQHLLPLAMNAILLVGTLTAMTWLHWRLSLVALLAFPLSFLLTRKTRNYTQSLYRDLSNTLESGESYLNELFPGLRTVRALNAQAHEKGRWREWLTAHRRIKATVAVSDERRPASVAPPPGAALAFNNVSFDYGRGDFGARDLTFRVEPGEFVGIVGPSGGGKSTIIDLIMGFYTPRSGSIALDGIDLQELSLASLRSQIGLVSQDLFFWNDSISRNINYPRPDEDAGAVSEAARAAQIDEFITGLPRDYRTVIGERGLTLSGGERQRLAIARALRKRPRLLLFDEATSALDALTELKVRTAFEQARAGRTAIVVAHRLSTILAADRILVIDQGRIVETGSREELLTLRGLFHDLYKAQSFDLPEIAL